jgi:hypothetical protein
MSVVFTSNAFVITNDGGACQGEPRTPGTQKGVII